MNRFIILIMVLIFAMEVQAKILVEYIPYDRTLAKNMAMEACHKVHRKNENTIRKQLILIHRLELDNAKLRGGDEFSDIACTSWYVDLQQCKQELFKDND